MIRIAEVKDNYVHKCIQCGLDITYTKWGREYCGICKASQRITSRNRKNDMPLHFIMSLSTSFSRRMYHFNELMRPT